jgi:hypothetical protein
MHMSRDSSVGIATGSGLDDRGLGVPVWPRIFFTSSRLALGSNQPLIQRVLGVKRPGSEADHSLLAVVEVKELWIHISTPP